MLWWIQNVFYAERYFTIDIIYLKYCDYKGLCLLCLDLRWRGLRAAISRYRNILSFAQHKTNHIVHPTPWSNQFSIWPISVLPVWRIGQRWGATWAPCQVCEEWYVNRSFFSYNATSYDYFPETKAINRGGQQAEVPLNCFPALHVVADICLPWWIHRTHPGTKMDCFPKNG